MGALCAEIGLPKGVVQILCTDGYDVADALTASTIPQLVTLIGSTKTGQHIMRVGGDFNQTLFHGIGGQRAGVGF